VLQEKEEEEASFVNPCSLKPSFVLVFVSVDEEDEQETTFRDDPTPTLEDI
jgi:hypothetical protein